MIKNGRIVQDGSYDDLVAAEGEYKTVYETVVPIEYILWHGDCKMDVFNRLAPFIQDFFYENKWEELHGNQVAACQVIFDSDDNLLLSSGTASGKTEAAFLPVLTHLYEKPSRSVGVMYISPLKALINDQFKRLEQMLLDSNIPVTKWHGDASVDKKDRLIKHPEGILQITPESLESLITNKRGACLNMFCDLRFVIIDEVHSFMRDERGLQLLCVLERLRALTGVNPRRIGLSATLGDMSLAQDWLNTGTGRKCAAPVTDEGKKRVRLHIERFVNVSDKRDLVERNGSMNIVDKDTGGDMGDREHYEYLFRQTLDKKTIIFANSREEIEFIMANLREIALKHKAPDVYRVHHGNVSALLRETTEDEMKSADEKIVTGATVTLELGIDIGSLDQAVQIGAPLNVSSPEAGPLRTAGAGAPAAVHLRGEHQDQFLRHPGPHQLGVHPDDRHHRAVPEGPLDGAHPAQAPSL